MKRSKRQFLSLPPRWLNCPKMGAIVNDLFLPFKTPLDEQYDDQMNSNERFHLKHVLSSSESDKIGLIINLTKTDRYYDANALKSTNKKYEKIPCEGHDGAPTKEQVENFIEICSNFFEENEDLHIGVHCTHGFNRTGFMIISFLCDKYDVELDDAVQLFANARPPGIYKQDYLDELALRHNFDGHLPAPERPSWCFESPKNNSRETNTFGDTFNLSDDENESNNDVLKHKRKNKYSYVPVKIPAFMKGVSGVTPVTDETIIEEVQQNVRELLNSTKPGFLGSHPVSMTRDNLKLLAKNDYMVSWKADGTRYIMLIADQDMVYMFDRDNCVYKVENVNFLKSETEYHANTLVDGEMVIDTYREKKFPRFLIYDIMNYNGTYVGDKTFGERLNIIKKQIIDTRNKYVTAEMKLKESFGIRMKDFWPIGKASGIWEGKFRNELCHEMDGLIFQPSGPEDGYVQGRCNTILKWKPPHLNSIDFQLKCEYVKEKDMVPRHVGFLYVSGTKKYFDKIENIKKDLRDKYNNKIVECTVNSKSHKWEIIRERTDKSVPNHISTAESVMKSICEPVFIKHVYDAINYKLNH